MREFEDRKMANNLKALSKKLISFFLTLFLTFLLLTVCVMAKQVVKEQTLHFEISYWDNKDTDYDNNCTQNEINNFANILDTFWESYRTFGFTVPQSRVGVDIYRRDLSKPPDGIKDINAWGGPGGMWFDPYFLGPRTLLVGTEDIPYICTDTGTKLVAAHELLHVIQGNTNAQPWTVDDWVVEGQARMMQDKIDLDVDHSMGDMFNYYDEVSNYLANPDKDLTKISYSACLFWTYVTEKYGGQSAYFQNEPQLGVDLISKFWDEALAKPTLNGIEDLNKALEAFGHTTEGSPTTLEDVFRDFIVANYVKDLTGAVPAKYKYADENQPGARHYDWDNDPATPAVNLSDVSFGSDIWSIDGSGSVNAWAANYYRIKPSITAAFVNVQVTQKTNDQLSYHLLLIKGGDLVQEYRLKAKDFAKCVVNLGYDEIVLIIGGLKNTAATTFSTGADYKYEFSIGTSRDVVLDIESPLGTPPGAQARVEWSYNPRKPAKFFSEVQVFFKGYPVIGLEKSNFEVRVGGIPANIATLIWSGRYFLLINAPNQEFPGLYELQVGLNPVSVTGVKDLEPGAVRYGCPADNVLVIDRSGGMRYPPTDPPYSYGKISAAQLAAKLFVDSFLANDMIGVVSFNEAASLDMILKNLSTARDDAKTVIDGIEAGGRASIGGGLLMAQNQLYTQGSPEHSPVIILLSDVPENAEPYVPTVKSDITGNGTTVHAIALGADANQMLLKDLADSTGGTFQYAEDPASGDLSNDLTDIYRYIAEKISNQQRVLAERGDSKYWNTTIPIDREAKEAIFVFSYNSSSPIKYIELRDPANNPVLLLPTFFDSADTPAGVMGYVVWRVQQPQPGDWHIRGEGNAITHYLVEAAVRHDLTFDLIIPRESGLMGEPVSILTSLAEDVPVLDADVLATITTPGNLTGQMTHTIRLFDDGEHGDGSADDGVYGNFYTQTSQSGTYVVRAVAEGSTPSTGPFRREDRGAIYIEADTDTDRDGMPDTWEKQHGLDPGDATGDNGADGDPDHDYLSNRIEFLSGTDPMNSDTDGAGESDGSEVRFGRNPTNEEDDTIVTPTSIYVHPGNTCNEVYFSVTASSMRFYRWTTDPFSEDSISAEPTGFYNDTDVVNYRTYYYRGFALNAQGAWSGCTAIASGTPKVDTEPPEGVVLINYGAEKTQTSRVTLALSSSGDATEMKVSNDPSFASAAWEPFVTQKEWVLKEDRGVQAVFALFKDGEGNVSPTAHDSILLETLADLDGNGVVNILDIAIVAKAFGTKAGEERWDPLADLDKNSVINILDIAAVARDFGKTLETAQSSPLTVDANSATNVKTVVILLTPVTVATSASKRKHKIRSYLLNNDKRLRRILCLHSSPFFVHMVMLLSARAHCLGT